MQNAESIKNALKSRLLDMVESRGEYLKYAEFLAVIGIKINNRTLLLSSCLDDVTRRYIDGICERVTHDCSGGTPAKISIDSDLYQIFGRSGVARSLKQSLVADDDAGLETDNNVVDRYLDILDFEAIAKAINVQAASLKEEGLAMMGKIIIDELNLRSEYWSAPRLDKNRVVCRSYAFNYWHANAKIANLKTLQNGFSTIENEAGLAFGSAMADYITAAGNLCYGQEKIASRTVCGKGGHLEIHCFKDKHEYRFSKTAFDAILAFLTINGHPDATDAMMANLYGAEAA